MESIKTELIGIRYKIDKLIKLLENDKEEVLLPKRKGRPRCAIFCTKVNETRLADSIKNLHQQYFNQVLQIIEVNGVYYNETDFLLCVYFALIKIGLAPSIRFRQINKQYYSFLKDKCQISTVEKERTYNNHLNKVTRTGCDLHLLTVEIVRKKQSAGSMKPEELFVWHSMLNLAEGLLLKDEYVVSLAKK